MHSDEGDRPNSCCNEGDHSDSCCNEGPDGAGGASCQCGPPPARASRIKTLIFAAVMLAALAVAAYSLTTKSSEQAAAKQDCGSCTGSSNCCDQ